MNVKVLIAVVCAAGLIGACDSTDDTNKPVTPPTTPPPAPTAADTGTAASDATAAANKAAADTGAAANAAATDAKAAANTAAANTQAAASDAAAGASAASTEAQTQAQQYFDQVMMYIKEKKLTDAQTAFDKLAALRDKLPATWQAKIDQAKTALQGAKTAEGLKLPGLGGTK